MSDDDADFSQELLDAYEKLMDAFEMFNSELKQRDAKLWSKWRAGGKIVSNNNGGKGSPNAHQCMIELGLLD